ncbi:hypothetical protein GcM3_011038, partial [Golovinomyces cichoracearum]
HINSHRTTLSLHSQQQGEHTQPPQPQQTGREHSSPPSPPRLREERTPPSPPLQPTGEHTSSPPPLQPTAEHILPTQSSEDYTKNIGDLTPTITLMDPNLTMTRRTNLNSLREHDDFSDNESVYAESENSSQPELIDSPAE